jgi:tetratricopeptide (TPR) repeat protein
LVPEPSIPQQSKDDWSLSFALNALALMAVEQEDYERAEALWEESLALGRKLGDRQLMIAALLNMGYTRTVRGDFERAGALLEEDLAIARESRDPSGTAMALLTLGIVATRRGDHGHAKALLDEGLVLVRKLGSMEAIAECLETLAEVAGALRDPRRAARLWGAADALREATGSPWLPLESRLHEPYLTAARSGIDQADWTMAWEEGRAMPLEDAIAYALDDAGERA